ncbi:MAG: ATP citrate lyase citrate-binding domain-containing protein [bacterium]|nr:ATP citrate lyase citrate-binding domain-containing protein [bacterium]
MKLLEHQGKALFQKYGIKIPNGELLKNAQAEMSLDFPVVLKSQVLSGERKKKKGIIIVEKHEDFRQNLEKLFLQEIDGSLPESILVEERIDFEKELYVSLSYDTDYRKPVLALSLVGGTGIEGATLVPIDVMKGLPDDMAQESLSKAHIPSTFQLSETIQNLWKMFQAEQALLVEINPLFELKDGTFVAGDAKVVLDDNVVDPQLRPFIDLGGDIAILASGGGASMLNLDILMREGGRPANYVEYSGNPPASVVEELTLKVLSRPNLKGCWVIGGTANFTDVAETMLGFVQGLRKLQSKPAYPIVIRRDGPKRKEGFEMLEKAKQEEGYDFHLYGPETSMAESAKIIVRLAYGNPH